MEQILELKGKNKQESVITLLVNRNDEIIYKIIEIIASQIKRLNIITQDKRIFNNLEYHLNSEYGILLNVTSNYNTRFEDSEILINVDFEEKEINSINIPNNIVILNIPKDINIYSRKFSGINIKSCEIYVPKSDRIDGFSDICVYEESIFKDTFSHIFSKIEKDKIKIKNFIGVNGTIDKKEFR